jgi:hypothetical protein
MICTKNDSAVKCKTPIPTIANVKIQRKVVRRERRCALVIALRPASRTMLGARGA